MNMDMIARRILFAIIGAIVGAFLGFVVAWPVWWIAGWLIPMIRPTLAFMYEGPPPLWLHGAWALLLGFLGSLVGYVWGAASQEKVQELKS